MSQALRLWLLGEFNIFYGEQEITTVNTPRMQSLLAYLILYRDVPQSRQRLAFLFWPDSSDSQARANLRNLIYQLRQALPVANDAFCTTTETLYWRSNPPISLDVIEFEHAVASGFLQQAVDIYQGDLLPGCYQDWILPERGRLQQIYLSALQQLVRNLEADQNYRTAIEYAQRLLRDDPLRETTYQQLMRLYALSGDRIGIRRTYNTCAAVLQKELAIAPSVETRQVYERSLSMAVSARPAAGNAPSTQTGFHSHNLITQLTRFIGRKHEKKEIKRLVLSNRLVTLTGAGGIGKTRLALAVASELLDEFPDGVWHVDLAPLYDADQVAQAVASVLGLREESMQATLASLAKSLSEKRVLLILDNCEHLVEVIRAMVEIILVETRDIHILSTSRVVLGVTGEMNWRVPSLSVPVMSRWKTDGETVDESSLQSLHSLCHYESVQVFMDRAATVLPTFTLTKKNARAIGQICEQLDGIPLALELAAARIKVLTAQQITGHLKDALWLLAQGSPSMRPHHQSMMTTMDWSHSLLTGQEQALFRRLSVFAGGASFEAIEAVCSGEDIKAEQVLNLLSSLVDKSLVNVDPTPKTARFALHEIARQYALVKLEKAGEQALVRNRHLRFFCNLAEALEPDISGAITPDAGHQLNMERHNLRAALRWSLDPQGDAPTGLRLASALPGYWELQGSLSEERFWLEELLEKSGAALEPEARAKALCAAGQVAYFQCDFRAARAYFGQSIALDREQNNQLRLADTLSRLGFLISAEQEYVEADPYYQESLSIFRALGDRSGILRTLSELGYTAVQMEEHERARAYLEESLAMCQSPHDDYEEARVRHFLGHLNRREGNFEEAKLHYRRSVGLLHALNNSWGLFYTLGSLAYMAVIEGQYKRAARLFGYTQHLGEKIGTRIVPCEYAEHERYESAARAALSETIFSAEWAKGRAMTQDEAVRYALE